MDTIFYWLLVALMALAGGAVGSSVTDALFRRWERRDDDDS